MIRERLIPDGKCWCGCGQDANLGRFFILSHDRWAESAIIKIHYGSIAAFLKAQGYGPGGKNLRDEYAKWERDNA